MNLLKVKILGINGELGHIIKLNKIINLNGENLWIKKKVKQKTYSVIKFFKSQLIILKFIL